MNSGEYDDNKLNHFQLDDIETNATSCITEDHSLVEIIVDHKHNLKVFYQVDLLY
jgi:hypothetical protein